MIERRTMYLDSYLSYRYTCWLEYNTNSLAIFSLLLLFFLLQFRDGARRRRQRLQEVWGQHHVSHSGRSQRHLLLVRLQPPVPQPFPQVGTCVAYWQMNNPKSGNQQARISNGYCCMTNPVRKSCTSLCLLWTMQPSLNLHKRHQLFWLTAYIYLQKWPVSEICLEIFWKPTRPRTKASIKQQK